MLSMEKPSHVLPCKRIHTALLTAMCCLFRSDNILALELDLPERVTFDMLPDGQGPDPRVQAAIDSAFWEDGHILLLGPPGSPQQQLHLVGQDMSGFAMSQKQQRPGSAARRHTGAAAVVL